MAQAISSAVSTGVISPIGKASGGFSNCIIHTSVGTMTPPGRKPWSSPYAKTSVAATTSNTAS